MFREAVVVLILMGIIFFIPGCIDKGNENTAVITTADGQISAEARILAEKYAGNTEITIEIVSIKDNGDGKYEILKDNQQVGKWGYLKFLDITNNYAVKDWPITGQSVKISIAVWNTAYGASQEKSWQDWEIDLETLEIKKVYPIFRK